MTSGEPTFGAWLSHRCEPPCQLERIANAQKARKSMTRRELLVAFERADEAWLNQAEELEMANAYIADLTTTEAD